MTESKQGSGKRPLRERNFEIAVNDITINEDQLPRVSRHYSTEACVWTQHTEVFRHLSRQAGQ